jgi:hypothetical protein
MADAPVRGERSVVRNRPLSYSIPPGAKSASDVVRNLVAGVISLSRATTHNIGGDDRRYDIWSITVW